MRIALLADIHANLPALQAVLRAIKRHAPDRIISLGDQINLGPCPNETLELLQAQDVTCLAGNHERYVLAAMTGAKAYAGANFASLRFNAEKLTAAQITFDPVLRIGPATLCHALPGADSFPVYDIPSATERLREMQADGPMHILCGHGHNPTHIRVGNVSLNSIGSTGCMNDAAPGTTTFTLMDIERDAIALRPFTLAYDASVLPHLFKSSGMADFCPIMAHISCLQMMHNHNHLVPFVDAALKRSKARGEALVSEQTWRDADARYPWPDGVGTRDFWAAV